MNMKEFLATVDALNSWQRQGTIPMKDARRVIVGEIQKGVDMAKAPALKDIPVKINILECVKSALVGKTKIYRNGIHTTVKWGDGSITKVKCREDDKLSDEAAFEAALVKKIFGSRSAYKRFVRENTVDQNEIRRKKEEKKFAKRYGETET